MDKYENYNRVISDLGGYYLPLENLIDLLTYGFCYKIVMIPFKNIIELSGKKDYYLKKNI